MNIFVTSTLIITYLLCKFKVANLVRFMLKLWFFTSNSKEIAL